MNEVYSLTEKGEIYVELMPTDMTMSWFGRNYEQIKKTKKGISLSKEEIKQKILERWKRNENRHK